MSPRIALLVPLLAFSSSAQETSRDLVFHFAVGSSDLTPESRRALDALAAWLRQTGEHLVIEGHTDSAGGPPINHLVAGQRVERFTVALLRRGVPADQLDGKLCSQWQPVASNRTAAGRAANRRVVLHVGSDAPAELHINGLEDVPLADAEGGDEVTRAPDEAPDDEAPLRAPELAALPELPAMPAPHVPRGPRFWVAAGSTGLAVAGAGAAVAFLVDANALIPRAQSAQEQLLRADLTTRTRTQFELRNERVQQAIDADRVAAAVIGTVAATAAATALVLWLEEAFQHPRSTRLSPPENTP